MNIPQANTPWAHIKILNISLFSSQLTLWAHVAFLKMECVCNISQIYINEKSWAFTQFGSKIIGNRSRIEIPNHVLISKPYNWVLLKRIEITLELLFTNSTVIFNKFVRIFILFLWISCILQEILININLWMCFLMCQKTFRF